MQKTLHWLLQLTVIVGTSAPVFAADLATTPPEQGQRTPKWALKLGEMPGGGVMRRAITRPAVLGDTVFFASWDGYLYALDAATGSCRWRRNSVPVSGPVTGDGLVCFGSDDSHLYAIDAQSGKDKWGFKTDSPVLATPVISKGIVYFQTLGGILNAVNERTGSEVPDKDKIPTTAGPLGSVAIADGVVYAPQHSHLIAVDANTRKLLWTWNKDTGHHVYPPLVERGTVYCRTGDGYLFALGAKDGAQKWVIKTSLGGDIPATMDNTLYFGSGIFVYAIDARTGDVRWKFNTSGREDLEIVYDVIAKDDTVYASCGNGYVYILDRITGKLKWRFKVLKHTFNGPGPLLVDRGMIYFGSEEGTLYALSLK